MPSYLKKEAIRLIEGGVEAYLLAYYGINLPSLIEKRCPESRYAPAIGLLGAAVELFIKGCVFQAKGKSAVFSGSNRFTHASEAVAMFSQLIADRDEKIKFIWAYCSDEDLHCDQLQEYTSKFKTLLYLRAAGLHNASGPSRDVTVITMNDVYDFSVLLSKSKRVRPYIQRMPKPESPVLERFALIRDLNRRLLRTQNMKDKARIVRDLYLVMPYIPEEEPEWLSALERVQVTPKGNDVAYLIKNITKAHSIYLYKDDKRGHALPTKIDPSNPNAIAIEPHHLKRAYKKLVDIFKSHSAISNGAFEENKLDLPAIEIVLDLFVKGISEETTGMPEGKLTAQQSWVYVAAALSKPGKMFPFWFIIDKCFELHKLISYLNKVKDISGAHYLRKYNQVDEIIKAVARSQEQTSQFLELKEMVTETFLSIESCRTNFFKTNELELELDDQLRSLFQSYFDGKIVLLTAAKYLDNSSNSIRFKRYWMYKLVSISRGMMSTEGLVWIWGNKNYKDKCGTKAREILFAIDVNDCDLL